MSNKKKGKIDPTTFFYGFGAAVVLVGAMFKFLGWKYANEMFVIGLSIEALVFLTSAFERQTDDEEYKWEEVFPQLKGNADGEGIQNQYKTAMEALSKAMTDMSTQVQEMNKSMELIKNSALLSSKAAELMTHKLEDYNQLMEKYNSNIREINNKYDKMLKS